MLAVAASRTRVTVPVSGSWRARAVIRGPSVSGQAASGARPRCRAGRGAGEQGVGAVDLVAGGAEVLPDRAEVGAAGDAVLHQPGGLRLVGVGGAGAGVDAQLGLQRVADGAGADEADQAAGEDRCLRPGGQADGQPPGGDVIDRAAPGVGGGDAVADQPLVQRQIRELALLGARTGEASRPGRRDAARAIGPLARSGSSCRAGGCGPGGGAGLRSGLGVGHRVAVLGGDAEELLQVLAGDQAPPADLDVGQVAAAHLVVEQVAGQAGQAGGLIDGVGQPPAVRVLAGRPAAAVVSSPGGTGLRGVPRQPAGPGFRSWCRRGRVVIVPPRGRAAHFPGRAAGGGCRAGRPG